MNAPVDSFLQGPSGLAAGVAGAVVGTLLALDADTGEPLVTFAGRIGAAAVRARSVVALGGDDIGRPAVLVFEGGDPTRPMLLGLLRDPVGPTRDGGRGVLEIDGDGERLTISAPDRLVLRCGAASLTLMHSGTVLLEGRYVVSRASATNRIQGGSVQIN